jgi:cell division septation protein DedD
LPLDETAAVDPATSDLSTAEPVEVAPVITPLETDLAIDAPLPATQEDAVAAALAAALADGGDTEAAASIVPTASAKSKRPKSRPVTIAAATPNETAPSDVAAAPVVSAAEIDPSSIAAGTRLVQLGAYDDEAAARAGWADLQAKFPDLMAAKAMVIQSAQSGGRAFYRLRAHGFEGEEMARQFCASLLAENASCIPVTQK